MDNLTAGNPRAHAIRVYFENSGLATIYEGMPLCYNYDTDTNWFGGSVADTGEVTASTTTADGSQNESRYIRVELPADNNLQSFAGVVKRGGWVGKKDARVVDIYVPNGAIVPVRCDVDTTEGVTLLAITVDSQELGQPVEGTSRVVALASETETALGSTADITLAKLNENLSIYQDLDGTALSVGAGTGDYVVNSINVTTAQTTGRTCALHIKCTVSAGGGSDHYGLAFHAEGIVTGTPAVHVAAASSRLTITGGTPTVYLTGFKAYLKQTAGTMTSAVVASVLNLGLQVTGTFTDPALCWIYVEDNSTQHAQNFIRTKYLRDLPTESFTGDISMNGQEGIKVYCQAEAGTQQYYIPLLNALA